MKEILIELRKNFAAGILVVLPIVVTVFVLWWGFDKLVSPLINKVIRPAVLLLIPDRLEQALGLRAMFLWDVLGVIVVFIIILFVGIIARNIVGRKVIGLGEKILARIPFISKIYTSAQQIGQAFLGEKRTGFSKVVLFEYPRPGLYSFGLVSGETKGEAQEKTGEKVLSVFVPTTPNPTSGLLILVPEKDTIPLEMSVAAALKLLISGGTVAPGYNNRENIKTQK